MAAIGGSGIGLASATEVANSAVEYWYSSSWLKGLTAVSVKSSSAWSERCRSTSTLGRK
jgi:hypothetical protein